LNHWNYPHLYKLIRFLYHIFLKSSKGRKSGKGSKSGLRVELQGGEGPLCSPSPPR
jgi:hypothetical protein